MTDRTISLLVTLDQEYRVDDAEFIINAIKMIKGVLDVTTVPVKPMEDWALKQAIKTQVRNECVKKLYELCE